MLLFPIESYYWEQTDNNIRSIDYNKQISKCTKFVLGVGTWSL
jgi:hypothetical protein